MVALDFLILVNTSLLNAWLVFSTYMVSIECTPLTHMNFNLQMATLLIKGWTSHMVTTPTYAGGYYSVQLLAHTCSERRKCICVGLVTSYTYKVLAVQWKFMCLDGCFKKVRVDRR